MRGLQACADRGASDVASGAWSVGGFHIVALPALTAKGKISRIVAQGQGAGPVSLGRMDTDMVVTEYGAANLHGLGHNARALALIEIAPPEQTRTV